MRKHGSGHRQTGVTLVELMVVVAVIAIIAAIAIPAYNGYVTEARLGAIRQNMEPLRVAVEDYRLDNDNYGAHETTYSGAGLNAQYGWTPEGDAGAYAYSVKSYNFNSGNTITFDILVEQGNYWVRCEDRFNDCCDSDTASNKNACP